MQKVTFITGNQKKADLLARYLDLEIEHIKLDLTEIQSLDMTEVVIHKAKEAYSIVRKPVLVEDTSVVYHALGRLPGPFIKFFLHELGVDGICRLMSGYEDKSATATVNFAYCDGEAVKIFSAEMKGKITDRPKGEGGMGWDSTFIPEGFDITRAELDQKDYDFSSPRRKAAEKLKEYFSKND